MESGPDDVQIFAPLTVSNAAHKVRLSVFAHIAVAFFILIAWQVKFLDTVITDLKWWATKFNVTGYKS